jgi:DNA-binding transcriptional MerR regulator
MEQETPTPKPLRAAAVRKLTGATRGELRSWEANGLIAPSTERHYSRHYRTYDEAQIDRIRQVRYLKAKGLTPRGIEMALPELRAWEERSGKRANAEDVSRDAAATPPDSRRDNIEMVPETAANNRGGATAVGYQGP